MDCLYSPSRFLWLWAREAWYRRSCGRRFGHFTDGNLYTSCTRCGTPLL